MDSFWHEMRMDELVQFFFSGHPSIVTQLLSINTIAFLLFVIRRMRGPNISRRHVSYTLQWIFLFGNLIVLMEQQWMPMVDDGIHAVVWRYRNFIPYT